MNPLSLRYLCMIPLLVICLLACNQATGPSAVQTGARSVREIQCPEGFTLQQGDSGSFTQYLLDISLKKDNTVYLYDKSKKGNQEAQYAVLDIDVGTKDLQQCADAVIRLRAEWLYSRKKYAEIAFHFVNGQLCDYTKYAEGNRPVFRGNRFEWKKSSNKDYSYKTFRKYLELVFSYAGTASLIKELNKVPVAQIKAGDVFIQSGNPYGHAVIVLAVAKNAKGEKRFLLAQSYMPAQDIHVLRNGSGGAWYEPVEGNIETPEWLFSSDDLKRW